MTSEENDSRAPDVKVTDLEMKSQGAPAWTSNPLLLAVVGATIAFLGNAAANWWNGQLEDKRAEQARILEMLKTGSIKQAAENLKFLVKVGLITNSEIRDQVREYVANAPPDTGPALPVSSYNYNYASPTVTSYDYITPRPVEGSAHSSSPSP